MTSSENAKKLKAAIADLVFDTHRVIVENTPVAPSTPGDNYTPSHTGGTLRRSVVVEETDTGFIIGTNIPYAEFVEMGVGPHEITPKEAKALKFYSPSGKGFVFAGKVDHPGFEGRRMFSKGLDYFEQHFQDAIK
jgi:hypothetical protein